MFKKLSIFFKNLWCVVSRNVLDFSKKHSFAVALTAVLLVVCIVFACVLGTKPEPVETLASSDIPSVSSEVSSEESSSEIVSSEEASSEENSSKESSSKVSSKEVSSKKPSSSSKPPVSSKVESSVTPNTEFKFNSTMSVEDNIFMDSLLYTGYKMGPHKSGNDWVYILSSRKPGLNMLSNIRYGGGSTGYETSNGKPDLKAFARGRMVCASYVTYVYFNYLPNVAGIDTSMLTKPENPTHAQSWLNAAKDWVKKGYSEVLPFKESGYIGGYLNFKPQTDIPIGSIILYRDARKNNSTTASHVAIYAGYKSGYHWVYQVGNENGPELCAMERMLFGPDPQRTLLIVSTPSVVNLAAELNITLKDDSGKAISGVEFKIKNSKGTVKSLGKTDENGKLSAADLEYGKQTLIEVVPDGYTSEKEEFSITLSTVNNSVNSVEITNKKK